MASTDLAVQLAEQGQPARGDADRDDAAVLRRTLTGDEPPPLQLVEQPGDVRGAGDEAAGQGERGERLGVPAAQQAQGVVLLRGEVVPPEQLVLEGPQPVVSPPEVQEGLLLRRIEATNRALLTGRAAHAR